MDLGKESTDAEVFGTSYADWTDLFFLLIEFMRSLSHGYFGRHLPFADLGKESEDVNQNGTVFAGIGAIPLTLL